MKRNLIICFVLFPIVAFAASPTWTTPSKVTVAAFAVDDYSEYYKTELRTRSLKRSIYHRDMFVDSLFAKVKRKYPGKERLQRINVGILRLEKKIMEKLCYIDRNLYSFLVMEISKRFVCMIIP